MLSTVYAKLTLAEGLTVTSRLGYERSNSIDSRWNPIYYITSEAQNSSVTLRNNISRNSRWLWENFASYTKKLENITLQVYWDTQLKKKESILFFKRFKFHCNQNNSLISISQTEMMLSVEIYIKKYELCF
jgi:hypothetical protein